MVSDWSHGDGGWGGKNRFSYVKESFVQLEWKPSTYFHRSKSEMWAAHGVTSKSRARWLWLLFCRCAVGLQRVNVNNPGGIDLEIGLALSALWVSLASSSMCFPSSAYKVKKGTQLRIRRALAGRIQPASTCVVAPRQRLAWALWTLRPAPHSRRLYPLVSLTDSELCFLTL